MKAIITILILAFCFPAISQAETGSSSEVRDFYAKVRRADRYLKAGSYNRAIKEYQKFTQKYPASCYGSVSLLQIAGIHQDYLHDYFRAKELYQQILSLPTGDRLTGVSKKIAKRWLERVGLVIVEEALKKYYAREVKYPKSLDELLNKGYLKEENLVDSWRKDYLYQVRNSSLFPKLKRQEYSLSSLNLKEEGKSIPGCVEEKKAFLAQFSLQGLVEAGGRKAAVIKYEPGNSPERTELLREGEEIGGAEVLEVTERGAVLEGAESLIVLTTRRG